MKKIKIFCTLLFVILIMQYCGNSKKLVTKGKATEAEKIIVPDKKLLSYAKDISPILKASCTPCHYPPNGNKEPLDTYGSAKININDILARVKLPKDAVGFMPFRNPNRALSDSAIKVLEQWKMEGLNE